MKYEPRGRRLPKNRQHIIDSLFKQFRIQGVSGPHTEAGTTLAPLLNLLVERGVSFTLEYHAGSGYRVRKGVPDDPEGRLGASTRFNR